MGKTLLVVGSGGREHALVWKVAQSPKVDRVIIAPGNDGIFFQKGSALQLDRWHFSASGGREAFEKLAKRAKEEGVDLAVVGPDNPLADGLIDVFSEEGVPAFGPSATAAQIEASKLFAKEIMKESGVPMAEFWRAGSERDALAIVDQLSWESRPNGARGWVVKADGLAFGKGVKICETHEEAVKAVQALISISGEVLIEERLVGEELSWMAICDGKNCALLDPARDYKRLLDNQSGPNTGGMGAFSPVPEVMSDSFFLKVQREIFEPVLKEMEKRGAPFKGLLYAGLMYDSQSDRISVLEFNARFGDPEAQVLLSRMDGDLVDWMEASVRGEIADRFHGSDSLRRIPFRKEAAVIVVAASPGYPESPEKGIKLEGPIEACHSDQSPLPYFFAGVKKDGESEEFFTSGGRVFGAVGLGREIESARVEAYENLKKIQFPGMHVRSDIAGGEKLG